jgi:hypothetical protein
VEVSDSNDEAQSYITHMMLCLHASVPHIIKKSLPAEVEKILEASPSSSTHNRSISYTPALLQSLTINGTTSSIQNAKKGNYI